MVAERSSDCIGPAAVAKETEVYRHLVDSQSRAPSRAAEKSNRHTGSVQLDARLHAPAQKTPDGVERNADVAVNRKLMQLVQRCVHRPRDQSLDEHAAANEPAHQVSDGG